MTYEIMTAILDDLKIPYAYHQFEDKSEIEGADKYIAYFEFDKNRFIADDIVYHYEPHFAVELYTRKKDLSAEQALIQLFDEYEAAWSGGDTVYLDDEKMYLTVFYV